MMYALIKYRAPTVDNERMPLFLYAEPLKVLEETEDSVCVVWEYDQFYLYWFKKKYIDRQF